MKRVRSPNYPSLPLAEAVDLVRKIHAKNRTNPIDREAAVKDMGYTGLTGRSAKLLATLQQYGLLERSGKGGVRVSQGAVDIMHPNPSDQSSYKRALQEAAFAPSLFAQLKERFPDGVPSENALRSYLTRENFADIAISPTINSFLETYRFLQQENATESHRQAPEPAAGLVGGEDGDRQGTRDLVTYREPPPAPPRSDGVRLMDAERVVFVEELGPSQYLKLVASGELDESLLEALEDYVARQKKRLERLKGASS